MSGGFFRGTTADQDTRFSNKHAKLLKSQKFHPELENLVDMTKVKMDVMRPWIAHRVTELLGFEDEVLINFIYGLLEEKVVNGKEIQISLTGFMEKNTGKFMKELWTHLLSAQENASGVPQQFLDAKAEETRKKQEDTDRITSELKKAKEKEDHERTRRTRDREDHRYDHERVKMDREVDNVKAANLEHHSRRPTKFSSKWSADDKVTDEKNGSKETARNPGSPHSADRSLSPTRGTRSRSISRSISNSRSPSRSRSLSASPKPLRRSVSSERRHSSLSRRSNTPHQTDSRGRSPSPVRRRFHSPARRRSRSPLRRRSRSPIRRRSRSPIRRRSRSPIRRRSRSPIRRRSRSPIRRRSRSPVRRRSRSPISRRSRSPIRRRARSPIRRRSRSPIRRRSPFRRRSPSPFRRRSPSPFRRRSPLHFRRRSPSPFQRRPRSPYRHRSQSPVSPSRNVSLSPSPVRRRSPSPMRRRNQRAPSTPRHQSPSPVRSKITNPGKQRSPSPGSMSSSPSGRISLSPKRDTPPSMLRRGSPKHQQRSPSESPRDGHRVTQRNDPDRQMPRKDTAVRPTESRKASSLPENLPPPPPLPKGRRVPALSPSPYNSPPGSVSPPAARRIPSKERSPIPRKRQRESMNSKDRDERVELEEQAFSRPREERRENKYSVNDEYDNSKYSPEKSTSHLPTGTQAQKRTSTNDEGRRKYSELADEPLRSRKDVLSSERERVPEKGYKVNEISQEAVKLTKVLPTVEREARSGSFDSGSEESDHKKKRKRSRRKDVTSDDDDSHDSRIEDRKEAKRRRKEERKLKKEEKRRRREERRHKKDSRRTEKLKLKAGRDVSPSSDLDKSHNSREEALSDPKKLEIELREKALESLRAKKGVGH